MKKAALFVLCLAMTGCSVGFGVFVEKRYDSLTTAKIEMKLTQEFK